MIGHIDQLFLIAFARGDIVKNNRNQRCLRIGDRAKRGAYFDLGLVHPYQRQRQALLCDMMTQVQTRELGKAFLEIRNGARGDKFEKRPSLWRFTFFQAQQGIGCIVKLNNGAVRRDGQNAIGHVLNNRAQAGLVITHLLFGLAQFAKC